MLQYDEMTRCYYDAPFLEIPRIYDILLVVLPDAGRESKTLLPLCALRQSEV
jgi:hypothetical protein